MRQTLLQLDVICLSAMSLVVPTAGKGETVGGAIGSGPSYGPGCNRCVEGLAQVGV